MMKNLLDIFKTQMQEVLDSNISILQFTACDCGSGPVDCCVDGYEDLD